MNAIRSLVQNPLFVMGVRRRLRRKQLVGYGLVMFLLTLFIYVIIYLTTTQRGIADPERAAEIAFVWILVLQGIVLMFLGTGNVAAGIADDREKGLLDYQRMTPMTPTSKIVGYLFGLPVREYYMFAITIPFMLFSIVVGRFAVSGVIQLYAVFMSSVLLYHMTGMVAGMLAKNPRRAARLARVLVILLYLVLPRLSHLGITFFEFLRPYAVLAAVLGEELNVANLSEDAETWRRVGFFSLEMSPTVFTLLLQGTLLWTLYSAVRRKWRHETSHAIAKNQAVGLYAAMVTMIIGSLWPILADRDALGVFENFGDPSDPDVRLAIFVVLFCVYAVFMVFMSFFLICVTTPERYQYVKGIRRAKKRGLERVPRGEDAASGLWTASALFGITAVGYLILAGTGVRTDVLVRPLALEQYLLPLLLFAAIISYVQVLREYTTPRYFWLGIGLMWIVPTLVAIVLLAAWSAALPAMYVGVTNPVGMFAYAFLWTFMDVLEVTDDAFLSDHFVILPILGAAVHFAFTGRLLGKLRRRQKADRAAASGER